MQLFWDEGCCILNAYAQLSVTENVWTILGPEFGKDAWRTAMIVGAMYEMKSVGTTLRSHLSKQCNIYAIRLIDPNLWMSPEIYPDNMFKNFYYMTQIVYSSTYISHFPWSQDLATQIHTLGLSCTRWGWVIEYGHGPWVWQSMSESQLETIRFT